MLTIRPLTLDELSLGVDWAAREGWNPGLQDAAAFHAADPQGFLGGWVDGRLVAMISAVRYGAGFGFIGFYLVEPGWRGQGHGLAVWNAGMARLAGRLVGLDGVVAQQANYRRSCFELAWNNVRYQGRVAMLRRLSGGSAPTTERVVPGDGVPLDALLDHDQPFFPDDRREFMVRWLRQPDATLRVAVRGADSQVAGLVLARPCREGFKIGPLWADDSAVACRLLTALADEMPAGATMQWDVPAPNAEAVGLANACGLDPVFQTARMYTGPAPEVPMARMFGITSFELG
jgi:hypothetical protein